MVSYHQLKFKSFSSVLVRKRRATGSLEAVLEPPPLQSSPLHFPTISLFFSHLFPTANIEEDALRDLDYEAEGVFYGWSLLDREGEQIEPMVMR